MFGTTQRLDTRTFVYEQRVAISLLRDSQFRWSFIDRHVVLVPSNRRLRYTGDLDFHDDAISFLHDLSFEPLAEDRREYRF